MVHANTPAERPLPPVRMTPGDPLGTLRTFRLSAGAEGRFHSLAALAEKGYGDVSRLPVSLRIVLESLLRNLDGARIKESDVRALAGWKARAERTEEVPFVVARIVLQDFTGRAAAGGPRGDAVRRRAARQAIRSSSSPSCRSRSSWITPSRWTSGTRRTHLRMNMEIEFHRNRARYEFLKWGMQAFRGFEVVPPGIGIVHQVNLEYLAPGVSRARRHLLPRLARRNRLAHDHDQRPRHRRLGRRRDRGRGRNARAAGVSS